MTMILIAVAVVQNRLFGAKRSNIQSYHIFFSAFKHFQVTITIATLRIEMNRRLLFKKVHSTMVPGYLVDIAAETAYGFVSEFFFNKS